MTAGEHVHGEDTITAKSGRIFCSCGYERAELDGGELIVWLRRGGYDPEGDEMRAFLRCRDTPDDV